MVADSHRAPRSTLFLYLLALSAHVTSQSHPMTTTCTRVCREFQEAKARCLADRNCYSLNRGAFNAQVWFCMQPCRDIPRPCADACVSYYYAITQTCQARCSHRNANCQNDCFDIEFGKVKPRV
ncbi:cysteine-rich neurotrophic factor-like [Aplysia californica]|uniref:Cysteine-rich neurotrophic factor-like n=1 Tax=Aplysia californica TaxID=6500 RepID=A0ABM1VSF2_APLCA|nr:cysteine-rich neurotrophic factor-like [Aplysia californica]